jgi:thiol-disulfide isomerase/thioredoxin
MTRSRSLSLVLGILVFAVLITPHALASAAAPKPRAWRSGLVWLEPAGFDPRTLEGRVVIVEFWTFDCINCRRTIPAMRALRARLGDDVSIVGVHTPELDHERDAANVRRAIEREKITFPVAQDNAFTAWRAFDNHYWPAIYVLDRDGRIRHAHIGELHQGTPRWDRLLQVVEGLRAAPGKRG